MYFLHKDYIVMCTVGRKGHNTLLTISFQILSLGEVDKIPNDAMRAHQTVILCFENDCMYACPHHVVVLELM